jgi:hypothetical protein
MEVGVGGGSCVAARRHGGGQPGFPLAHARARGADLGTNNCRLLIARANGRGYRIIDAFSRIVRLGEGLTRNGALTEDAMRRTIEALKVCAGKISRRGVTHGRSVATEACRRASNCDEFLGRVRAETGLNIEISRQPKAQLASAAARLCSVAANAGAGVRYRRRQHGDRLAAAAQRPSASYRQRLFHGRCYPQRELRQFADAVGDISAYG